MARRMVRLYLFLAFLFSAAIYIPILRAGQLGPLVIALMWAPGVAALLTRLIVQRNVRGVGWSTGPARYLLAGLLLPLAGCVAVYTAVWATGLGAVDPGRLAASIPDPSAGTIAGKAALTVLSGLAFGGIFALGEELGWRGLLVPELFRYRSFGATVAVSGVVWALYHYPAILGTEYHSAAPVGFAMAAFTVSVMCVSVIAAWLRLRSGSVWPAVLLHTSHNTFVQSIFDPVTVDGPFTPYLTTEFGVGLMAFYAIVALYFWQHRGELRPAAEAHASRGARQPVTSP